MIKYRVVYKHMWMKKGAWRRNTSHHGKPLVCSLGLLRCNYGRIQGLNPFSPTVSFFYSREGVWFLDPKWERAWKLPIYFIYNSHIKWFSHFILFCSWLDIPGVHCKGNTRMDSPSSAPIGKCFNYSSRSFLVIGPLCAKNDCFTCQRHKSCPLKK